MSCCAGLKKHDYEYVRKYIEGFGYVLLSKVYVNAMTKLLVQCPEGHQYKVSFNNFKNSGSRCPVCAGLKKPTIEDVKKFYKNECYKYLSTTYTNAFTKELVQCPEGHQYEVNFHHFKNGSRCPVCYNEGKFLTIEYVRKYYDDRDYTYLSTTYTNNKKKELVQCPKGHQYEVSFGNFQRGRRCPICNNEKTSSKAEIELQEFVKTITNTKVICNDRTQIVNTNTGHYLELDIYLPYLNKAIEYNGKFWHSSVEAKIRDQMKVDQCKNLGIDLLVIHDYDYIGNEETIKEKLKEWLLG